MDLDGSILAAHGRGDHASLARLYREAAEHSGDEAAKGFFLTQAYVFALEAGLPEALAIASELRSMGRD